MSHNLILYSYWRSSCSYRVRMALEYKALPYEVRPVHLVRDGGEQHKDSYRALNPMRQVPYLAHGDRGLAQSMAIVEYLDQVFPQQPLFPEDVYDRARVRQLCEMINTGMQPVQNLAVLQELGRRFDQDMDGKADWSRTFLAPGFAALEQVLVQEAGAFCFGDQVTAVDCFLSPQIYNADRFKLDMTPYPTVMRIHAALQALPWVKKAHPAAQVDAV